jgi:hypothetical protein
MNLKYKIIFHINIINHYYKNKLFWLKNLIKNNPIWVRVKKTILLIWTSHSKLVLHNWGGLFDQQIIKLFN